eukprot:TRINITY_DN14561_c0_g1_i1.p1 TRINITY_DN14561_c0_g1~~TRINITY_DN14561_c0_g1_i1.p1  ORF type:complete len:117 (-),score=27.17 TRINITY_DN14561_c0_g1_i1:66-389(-)
MSYQLTSFAAVALTAGGLIGFLRAGSRASLIAGSVSGALYGLSAYLLNQRGQFQTGALISILVSAALIVVQGRRWAAADFRFPSVSGVISIIALSVALTNTYITYLK